MQFTHERHIVLDSPMSAIRVDWDGHDALAGRLSHIRTVAPGPSADLAHFTICLDACRLEFAVERTMNTDDTICWQSIGTEFLYVLCVSLQPEADGQTKLTLTIAYDPPGFLADVAESLGLGRLFDHSLDSDIKRFADSLQWRTVPALTLAE